MSVASLKDKIPPHNLEAEQATLGALLLDWDAVGLVISYLRPENFIHYKIKLFLRLCWLCIITASEEIF